IQVEAEAGEGGKGRIGNGEVWECALWGGEQVHGEGMEEQVGHGLTGRLMEWIAVWAGVIAELLGPPGGVVAGTEVHGSTSEDRNAVGGAALIEGVGDRE